MVAATLTATPLTPARALREKKGVNRQRIAGVVVMIAAMAVSAGFWIHSFSDTQAVLVVTRDVPAGAQLTAADLSIAHVRIGDALYQAAVPASERSSVVGKQLAEPIHAQQLLGRAQLSGQAPLAPDQLAMTIPVSADTATGSIRPGSQVQVIVTTNKGKPDSRAQVVLPRATVYEVSWRDDRAAVVNTAGTGGAGSLESRGAPTALTLLVSQDAARALSLARWNGDLDVALLPAAAPAAPAEPSR